MYFRQVGGFGFHKNKEKKEFLKWYLVRGRITNDRKHKMVLSTRYWAWCWISRSVKNSQLKRQDANYLKWTSGRSSTKSKGVLSNGRVSSPLHHGVGTRMLLTKKHGYNYVINYFIQNNSYENAESKLPVQFSRFFVFHTLVFIWFSKRLLSYRVRTLFLDWAYYISATNRSCFHQITTPPTSKS